MYSRGWVVAHIFNIDGLRINDSGVASTSRGLVGDTVFAVIPNVKPIHTFIITIAFQVVSLQVDTLVNINLVCRFS